ncbi:VOC family protein [Mycobacterium sp. KBS0706]|uniref:bleomycin resistance protein n=1 Tax=Mycobacterium sp. KBS0706 TaxID=2578109 RepID=UPI00110F8E60|nr:VOC family protein [Mycobacterium sp. KBS0706]TSD85006.1 VOC family protein [Mycobacterium sp. KBS0706]
MTAPKLVPELYVSDIDRSRRFYIGVLGFAVLYDRPEERFAYLVREGAALMLEQPADPGRTWLAGPLEQPYGRGINLQIEVGDLGPLHAAVLAAEAPLLLPLEERWYRCGDGLVGQRQFVVQDPDGYLLRFCQDLGSRPLSRSGG